MPKIIPEGRNYVVDQIDRVPIEKYDMHFLADLNDDVVMLEWDIAVAQHDLMNFVNHCLSAPQIVHVAPYVLYPDSLDEISTPVWAHREMVNECPLQLRWIDYGESTCDIFSVGMVYLPRSIANRVAESDDLVTWQQNITDSKLAFWHYYKIGEKVPVHWDVRPIHLHYNQESFYDGHNTTRLRNRTVVGTGTRPRTLTSSDR